MAKKGKSKKPAAEKKEQPPVRKPAPELVRKALTACFLGWILPGAGHWYLGRRGRASIFLVVVALLLVLGILMDGQIYRAKKDQPLTVLAAFAKKGVVAISANTLTLLDGKQLEALSEQLGA